MTLAQYNGQTIEQRLHAQERKIENMERDLQVMSKIIADLQEQIDNK